MQNSTIEVTGFRHRRAAGKAMEPTPRTPLSRRGVGWEVSFSLSVAVLDVVATPLVGGGPTLPLWGRVVT